MNGFFNMIPGTDECCILLYGDIGDGAEDKVRSGEVVRELLELETAYKKIDVRINSNGGSVYAGIAIFNAFRTSKADITIYVDGIAASIASVIALCGKPVYMSKYARMMLHNVQGGTFGNKEDLKRCINEIEALENTLGEMYAAKCGKTADEIKNMFFDGKDHWLSATQAHELGFINGIYDTDAIPESSTPEQVYSIFQNRLNVESTNNDTMFEKLKERPSFANCASDEDVLRHIEHLETEAAKVPGLESKKQELENRLQTIEEDGIKTIVNSAILDGRIAETQRESFTNLFKSDRTNAEALLKSMKPKTRIVNILGGKDTVSDEFLNQSWDVLDKAGRLSELKAKHPEVYEAKFKEKFHSK